MIAERQEEAHQKQKLTDSPKLRIGGVSRSLGAGIFQATEHTLSVAKACTLLELPLLLSHTIHFSAVASSSK